MYDISLVVCRNFDGDETTFDAFMKEEDAKAFIQKISEEDFDPHAVMTLDSTSWLVVPQGTTDVENALYNGNWYWIIELHKVKLTV